MFKHKNRYPFLFFISSIVFLASAILIGIYLYKNFLEQSDNPVELALSTLAFMLACALAVPNVIVAIFWNDDKTWEDRLVALFDAMRLADLRKRDFEIEITDDDCSNAARKRFREAVLGSSRGGKFVRWRKFNAIMKNSVSDPLIYQCTVGAEKDAATSIIRDAKDNVRNLYRLNNDWFLNTTLFMLFWSVISALLLFISFFWLTKTYQSTFAYWYEFTAPKGFVTWIDHLFYTLNATVKGFIANLFEILSDNPQFFIGESIANVEFLKAEFTLVQLYEYIFRTLMALSLIPIAVALWRLVRIVRLPRKLKQRVGVESEF